jgi:hypothetical protein
LPALLLIPRELIKDEISNCPENIDDAINHLTKKIKGSEQAMSFRLSNLGYYIG